MAPPGPHRLWLPEGGSVGPKRVACPGCRADSAVKIRYVVPCGPRFWQQASVADSTTRVLAYSLGRQSLRRQAACRAMARAGDGVAEVKAGRLCAKLRR